MKAIYCSLCVVDDNLYKLNICIKKTKSSYVQKSQPNPVVIIAKVMQIS